MARGHQYKFVLIVENYIWPFDYPVSTFMMKTTNPDNPCCNYALLANGGTAAPPPFGGLVNERLVDLSLLKMGGAK